MAKRMEAMWAAPDFTLNDTQNNPVSLANFRGKQPVVLVFTRGFI